MSVCPGRNDRLGPEHQGSDPAESGEADADHRGTSQRADADAERCGCPADSGVAAHGRHDRPRGEEHHRHASGVGAGPGQVGQRVRAFPPESRSSMFQAKVTNVVTRGADAIVTATLSGPAHAGSTRYILEIVTEPLEVLSVPNEAIIESEGKRIVYVQVEKGRYEPREIETGLQGELYTKSAKV